ncbi:MAG: ABC transporter permease subunit, partial [Solirubrobacteraceae bacterium]|nr:ABC transporter permease subunit [Solirubrobacteraceae bacterium]
MSHATDITTEGTGAEGAPDPQRWGRRLTTVVFLGPAVALLVVWLVYPTLSTIYRSFFDKSGDKFVWFDNYSAIFSTPNLTTALQNNALWVAVVPALVTAIGLVLAVLTEKIRWQVAFRLAIFMPMAISLFAAGVIWRIMDDKDPNKGTINASIGAVQDALGGTGGVLTRAKASTDALSGSLANGFVAKATVQPGGAPVFLGLTGIPPVQVPADAVDVNPQAATAPAGSVVGSVWRDFKPGGGEAGTPEPGELGIPGATIDLRDSAGKTVQSVAAGKDGSFSFSGLSPGDYKVAIAAKTFEEPFSGVSWLGPKLINPSIMIAYIWVWAGFAMVIIAAGLASISREVLEAARTDGATEWQVFRHITAPMLAPVLSVVFITMLINVLKVFDIVLSVAPASSQDDANVIALAMWRVSFSGGSDFG